MTSGSIGVVDYMRFELSILADDLSVLAMEMEFED